MEVAHVRRFEFIGAPIYGLVLGFALVYVAMDLPALAQAAIPMGGVDFGPLATNTIAVSVMVLTVGAGVVARFLIGFLSSKAGLHDTQAQALLADRVNDILHRAVDYAEAWAKTQVADPNSQIHHVQIDNFFMAQAVRFAMSAMPDLIKTFGLTEARIEAMILARLNPIMPVPAANSGTPKTFSEVAVAKVVVAPA